MNPGLKGTFPFLSQLAANYKEYQFVKLAATYISLMSETTTAGQVGQVEMTAQYNVGDPPFENTIDFLNNIGTVSARPIDGPIVCGMECDPRNNVLGTQYVRTGAVPAGQDIKTYDLCRFELATEGMQTDNQIIGQLWFTYEVVLRKPLLYVSVGKNISNYLYKY